MGTSKGKKADQTVLLELLQKLQASITSTAGDPASLKQHQKRCEAALYDIVYKGSCAAVRVSSRRTGGLSNQAAAAARGDWLQQHRREQPRCHLSQSVTHLISKQPLTCTPLPARRCAALCMCACQGCTRGGTCCPCTLGSTSCKCSCRTNTAQRQRYVHSCLLGRRTPSQQHAPSCCLTAQVTCFRSCLCGCAAGGPAVSHGLAVTPGAEPGQMCGSKCTG